MGFLRAVLFDLGDVIMQELTEEKDAGGVTLRAELVDGIKECIAALQAREIPLALVADTRTGTAANVLAQHGLENAFPVKAISEELGVEKPHPRMFRHALERLGIPESEWHRVAMVGNNLARDIVGATRCGLIAIWFRWNERYPGVPETEWHVPDYTVSSAKQLLELLAALDASDRERALAAKVAPVIMFDNHEPFYPVKVGYQIFEAPSPSPSFRRAVDLYVDEDRTASKVIEYAIYWDWDIGHLYELEHAWVYLDQNDQPLRVDASFHGTYHVLGVAGRERPLPQPFPLYSQPGKHAFARSPRWFEPREPYIDACTKDAGNAGLLITPLFEGIIHKLPGDDELARAYLRQRAFHPSFSFENLWKIREELLVPWAELKAWIPRRISEIRAKLAQDELLSG